MSHISHIEEEIDSQPSLWRRAAEVARAAELELPQSGERVMAAGCGTSWFMAQAYAGRREGLGLGETDAWTPTELPEHRRYDRAVLISRSGTTTEVIRLLEHLREEATLATAIVAVADSPVGSLAGHTIALDEADERSVVQTRFATSALALLRAHLYEDIEPVAVDADRALAAALPFEPDRFDHFVFLGHGWTVGLANEAALKLRETAQAHAESYPAMEYRHGPISLAGPASLVWILGSPDADLAADIAATGATIRSAELDPMAELVMAQRTAVSLAAFKGLDPDHPRNLTRSVQLS
jgi:fructoselysine-6-P-deglycase FrlB-like protein